MAKSSSISRAYWLSRKPIVTLIGQYPAGTLIPYYGVDPNLADWTRYSTADGCHLMGAVTQSGIGTYYPQIAGQAYSGSVGSAGAHGGTSLLTNVSSVTGGGNSQLGSAGMGSHSHTVSGSASWTGTVDSLPITLLKSTNVVTSIPTNSVLFKQTTPGAGATPIYSSVRSRYLKGANLSADPTEVNGNISTAYSASGMNTSTDGDHSHASTSSVYTAPTTGTDTALKYSMGYAGAHYHGAGIEFRQSVITSRLLNLWKLIIDTVPTTDAIVMYVGSLAELQQPWFFCDGTNGTVDLRSYIVGYSTGNAWNTMTYGNASATGTITNAVVTHSHTLGQIQASAVGTTGYHNSYAWSHTHTLGSGGSGNFSPASTGVAFIQYKG